jgi:hypothetical protein
MVAIRTMNLIDVNQALRIYLGSDQNGGVEPYGMVARVEARYGSNASTVIAELESVLDGLYQESDVINLPTLADIAIFVEKRVRLRRPDLEDDVCKAIGNYVSYSYR